MFMTGKMRDMLIMCRDTPVLAVNFNEDRFKVLNEKLIPFRIKGAMTKEPIFTGEKKYDLLQEKIYGLKNKELLISWLANRALSLSRKNAKWLYNLLKVEQVTTDKEKAKISIACRAVSVLDDYWLKLEVDNLKWKVMIMIRLRNVPAERIET